MIALYIDQVHPPRVYLVRVLRQDADRVTVARLHSDGTSNRLPFHVTDGHRFVMSWPTAPGARRLGAIRERCMPKAPMSLPLARNYIRDRIHRERLT